MTTLNIRTRGYMNGMKLWTNELNDNDINMNEKYAQEWNEYANELMHLRSKEMNVWTLKWICEWMARMYERFDTYRRRLCYQWISKKQCTGRHSYATEIFTCVDVGVLYVNKGHDQVNYAIIPSFAVTFPFSGISLSLQFPSLWQPDAHAPEDGPAQAQTGQDWTGSGHSAVWGL